MNVVLGYSTVDYSFHCARIQAADDSRTIFKQSLRYAPLMQERWWTLSMRSDLLLELEIAVLDTLGAVSMASSNPSFGPVSTSTIMSRTDS